MTNHQQTVQRETILSLNRSGTLSQNLANTLGEQHGRSTSRVLADGLRSIVGGGMNPDESVDLVHVGMAATVVGAAVNPKAAAVIGVSAFLLGLTLWNHGQT